jgi:hypothetical protein
MPNPHLGYPRITLHMAPTLWSVLIWAAVPRAYAATSIAVWVTGAYKPPLHDSAVVLKEGWQFIALCFSLVFSDTEIFM